MRIHEAAKTGALVEVQRYLDEGEDVNKQDNVSAVVPVSLISLRMERLLSSGLAAMAM
jgi:hypothetical protein